MAEPTPVKPAAKKPPEKKEGLPKERVNSIGMKLVLIPAGRFVMGAPKTEKHRWYAEGPEHVVQITRPFYMGMYEVTQGEFEKVMGSNPSLHKKVKGFDTSRFPVEYTQYPEVVQFCAKLSEVAEEKKAGLKYRLPTEAEWEYACRAGTRTVYTHGTSISSKQANFNGWHPHPFDGAERGPYLERPTTVGSYKPNAFGLYDMHGNVLEWVSDWFGEKYYAESPPANPTGPKIEDAYTQKDTSRFRVLRGGSWQGVGSFLRSAERYFERETTRHEDHGFRVVAEI